MKYNTDLFFELIPPVPAMVVRPLWSVIIPTFNCAEYLKETLDSVLSQDIGSKKMEIIVVDDHSTEDDPEAVVRDYGRGRVQFIRQVQNVGKVLNYETGLKAATGFYIHQLHGDDKIRTGFYREMERIFNQNKTIGAAFCRTIYIDDQNHWTGITGMIQDTEGIVPNMLEKLYVQQLIQTPSMVVKREVYEQIGAFDRRLNSLEDWEMWIRIANNYPIAVTNKVLAEYRSHNNNATNITLKDGSVLDTHGLVFNFIDAYVSPHIKSKFGALRNQYQADFLLMSFKSFKSKLNPKTRRELIFRIIKLHPSLMTFVRLVR